MAEPTMLPALPELFSCTKLSARLSVRACGARFLKVRAATKGSADYTSACDQCPVGAHHARTGTLSPDTQTQIPTAMPATTTTTPKETPTMAAKSEYTDDQKRDAAKRILIDKEVPEAVGKDLSVSGTTIRNWVKRFGTEVASDAMDAAAGKEPKAKVAKTAKAAKKANAPKATPKRAPSQPLAEAMAATDAPRPSVAPTTATQDHLAERERVSLELGLAVRHIADPRTRKAVADAAWMLSQVAHG